MQYILILSEEQRIKPFPGYLDMMSQYATLITGCNCENYCKENFGGV